MSTRRYLRLLGVVAGIALSAAIPAPAVADPAADARADFERARRFFQAEEYEAALPLFVRAYELSGKRPSTILALAQCERAMKRYDDALRHFREYLATGLVEKEAAEIKQTIKLVEELAAGDRAAGAGAAPSPGGASAGGASAGGSTGAGSGPGAAASPSPAPSAGPPASAPPSEPPPAAVVAPAPPPAEESSVLASPWLWAVVGALVVGGAVTAGVVLGRGEPDLYGGTSGVVLYP